jgi:hypothetical protein
LREGEKEKGKSFRWARRPLYTSQVPPTRAARLGSRTPRFRHHAGPSPALWALSELRTPRVLPVARSYNCVSMLRSQPRFELRSQASRDSISLLRPNFREARPGLRKESQACRAEARETGQPSADH